MRILHVEDNDEVARATARLLHRMMGHEIVHARSVADAELLLEKENFDCILVDGTLDPNNAGDGANFAAKLHHLGRKVLIFSGDANHARIGVPFLWKGSPTHEIEAAFVRL